MGLALSMQVDRLGDEVEDLVSILEKVYIALDHYSPVLQHYTGVSSNFISLFTEVYLEYDFLDIFSYKPVFSLKH